MEVRLFIRYQLEWPCREKNYLYLDCINVIILVVIFYFHFARCYHWENLSEGYIRSFYIITCTCLWLYYYFKINSLIYLISLIFYYILCRNILVNIYTVWNVPIIITIVLSHILVFVLHLDTIIPLRSSCAMRLFMDTR